MISKRSSLKVQGVDQRNSNFPKRNLQSPFSKFRPIGLCNLSYKVITKILSNRLSQLLPLITLPKSLRFTRTFPRRMALAEIYSKEVLDVMNVAPVVGMSWGGDDKKLLDLFSIIDKKRGAEG